MSTIQAANISDGTISVPSTVVTEGAAKALMNYNQVTGPAINNSYNLSSVTDDATGEWTPNFTNSFADANYIAVGVTIEEGSNHGGVLCGYNTGGAGGSKLTSSFSGASSRLSSGTANSALEDKAYTPCDISLGDLA